MQDKLQDKLEALKERFHEVGQQIIQPEVVMDAQRYSKLSKEYKDLERIVTQYDACLLYTSRCV